MGKGYHVLIRLLCFFVSVWPTFGENSENTGNFAPPNIIFINVDDLGWKDVGFMGGDFFETPNIDALANEGMVFAQSYAGAANCAPSRACLMTGQNTPRHGVYTVSPSARGKAQTRKLIPVSNIDSLSPKAFTMAEMFKRAGYNTATFGKWHLGNDPTDQGFDYNVGGSLRGNPGKDGYFSPYNLKNIEDGPTGENLTDRLTHEAIRYISDHRQAPFFVYLPFYAVHTPLLAKKELVAKYASKENPLEIDPTFAAMVETVDVNIGKLRRALIDYGIADNTLIVFTSDNGGIRSISTQAPLRAGKGSYYEGGVRVPCIVKWPGIVKPSSSYDGPISNLDFFPTFQELLNVDLPGKLLDGKSLLPVLKGGALGDRPIFFHFPIYLQKYNAQKDEGRDPLFRTRPGAVVIYKNWKLHRYFEDEGLELYNLENDIGERNNLALTEPEKKQELLAMLNSWLKETRAPIPKQLNPAYVE